MSNNLQDKSGFSSFTINILFVLLIIIGISIIPLLPIQLNPTRYLPSMSLSFTWPLSPARVAEMEVTTQLEGMMSTVSGVKKVSSSTYDGGGRVSIEFDKNTDLQFKKFEVAALLRELRNKLPDGVSGPFLSVNMPENENGSQILSFQINGNASAAYIQQLTEETIKPRIAMIDGVYQVNVYGASPMQWEIIYDDYTIARAGITTSEIQSAISNYMFERELGGAPEIGPGGTIRRTYMTLLGNNVDSVAWENIPVKKSGGRLFRLGDLATIRLKEQKASSFFRINGLNTINLTVSAEKGVNHINVAEAVREEMKRIVEDLPPGYSVRTSSDSTIEIKKEIAKIVNRTIFSVVLLLIFVLIVSRELKYLMIITISLLANITIAFIFYYFLKLELHLYSLAGITVSFGIIIDNTIVMTDHIRHQKNRKVFLAILAATLTTVGALSVIFFMGEATKVMLADFSAVIIINLLVSLSVALFFIPALLDKINMRTKFSTRLIRRKRRAVSITNLYSRYIAFGQRFRWIMVTIFILGFGIPVFLLPSKLPKTDPYSSPKPPTTDFQIFYNKTIGNQTFNQKIRPLLNKISGGSLRLFYDKAKTGRYYYFGSSEETPRTRLNVSIGLSQEGLTIENLNETCMGLENLIARYDEIGRAHV